jgi:hypothetical protein
LLGKLIEGTPSYLRGLLKEAMGIDRMVPKTYEQIQSEYLTPEMLDQFQEKYPTKSFGNLRLQDVHAGEQGARNQTENIGMGIENLRGLLQSGDVKVLPGEKGFEHYWKFIEELYKEKAKEAAQLQKDGGSTQQGLRKQFPLFDKMGWFK